MLLTNRVSRVTLQYQNPFLLSFLVISIETNFQEIWGERDDKMMSDCESRQHGWGYRSETSIIVS